MTHLHPEELVDFAEGTRDERTSAHLSTCDACRAHIADLRATMAEAAAIEAPEPSPLFWDHFSARVHEAVAAEPPPSRMAGWIAGLRGSRQLTARLVVGPAVASAALAALVIAILTVGRSATVGVPSQPRDLPIATEAADVSLVPPDDPALDLVADLGASLNWDDVHDAGVVVHSGLVDRAVSGLSADERAELGKLLREQLRGGGN